MILLFLPIGIITTIIGALPPGASNVAVIKTTINEDIRQSLKIGYGASIGEVLLAFFAYSFGMLIRDFFLMNQWVQILFSVLLSSVGLYFILKRRKKKETTKQYKSKFFKGIFLGLINPPVLLYWVVVFSFLKDYFFNLNDSFIAVLVLLMGIFIGKIITLYTYGKLGSHFKEKTSNKKIVDTVVGISLVVLATLQIVKVFFFN
jgi:threonine/homoserine/homoserine lactone efflux protein